MDIKEQTSQNSIEKKMKKYIETVKHRNGQSRKITENNLINGQTFKNIIEMDV